MQQHDKREVETMSWFVMQTPATQMLVAGGVVAGSAIAGAVMGGVIGFRMGQVRIMRDIDRYVAEAQKAAK